MAELPETTGGDETRLSWIKPLRVFLIIWSGQLVSMIGSGLTSFALGVWLYQETGQAMPFALVALFSSLPGILLSPISGLVADRWNRRWIMIIADTGSAATTLFVVMMISFGELQVWQIYLTALFSSICGAFQGPAYMASVTMLVPKKDLGRVNGLIQSGQAATSLISPMLAGYLFVAIGLNRIILIDFITFFFAIGSLLMVNIPQPEVVEDDERSQTSFWRDAFYGWSYIKVRAGLLTMLIYYALVNFLLNVTGVLLVPLVLSFADADTLGIIQSVVGLGMLAGSILMGVWGGPKRKMDGVYAFIGLMGVGLIITGLRASAWTIGLGMFIMLGSVPLASGCSQVIWQSKVALGVQGRVFAIRGMIAHFMMPVAYLLAGALADSLFEPMMADGERLSQIFGPIIGVGPGRGIGLMQLLGGGLLLLVTAAAYLYPRMRLVEDELPDAIPDAPAPQIA